MCNINSIILVKALPTHLFKLYKYYLHLESDLEARRFYRYLSMRTIKGRLYGIIKLFYDLVIPLKFSFVKTFYYLVINATNNEILGVCHITIYKPKNYAIYGIVLSKQARGKGLAKVLSYYAIVNTLRFNNIKNIILHVDIDNARAIKLYKKLGFKIVSIVKEYGYRSLDKKYIDGYLMVLDLHKFIKHKRFRIETREL